MNIANIADLFQRVKRLSDDRYQACCPAHDDSSPSLTLRQSGDRVLVHCHAGCTFQEICDAVGLSPKEWFNDTEIPVERKPARQIRHVEREAYLHRALVDRNRLNELRVDLRGRDMARIAITKAVQDGTISEAEALEWLGPLAKNYAELEHEFSEVLARSVDTEWKDPLTPEQVDAWEARVRKYCEEHQESK